MFAVSYDFHDTVAICPTWFQLETRHLVSSAHAELVRTGALADGPAPETLDAAYRQLRLAIHEHGNERDAVGCVLDVLTGLDIACSCEAVTAAVERLQRATLADCRPRPGIVEEIQQLSAAGVPIGITSNAVYHPFLLWALERFGLLPLLRSVISSASCGYYKSRAEIFHATAAALDTPPECVIHVGDSFRFDVVAARRAGLRAVWLNLKGEAPPDPDLADLIVTDLDGLAGKIQRLAAGR
jgi:putative hydrolase of the HAD superfamily